MHDSTFRYLKPTDEQLLHMDRVRETFVVVSAVLEEEVPEGPDKTYLMRKLREVAMWANVAITRQPDGAPRNG